MKHRRQQGVIAFISVLVVALVAVTVMTDVAFDHQVDVRRTSRALAEQQAYLLALSTEQYYIDILFQETKPPLIPGSIANTLSYDGLDENWAIALPFLPVDNGSISAELIDLHSKFNINNMTLIPSWTTTTSFADALVPAKHSLAWGFLFSDMINGSLLNPIFPSIMPAVVDWLDTDLTENLNGAEDLFYLQPDYNYRTANNSFADISELNLIKGLDSTLIEPIEELLSVIALPTGANIIAAGNQTRLNVNTIDDPRLLAWLAIAGSDSSLSIDDQELLVEQILASRPFLDIQTFLDIVAPLIPVPGATTTPSNPRRALLHSMIGIQSQNFLLITQTQLGDVAMEVKSWIRRDATGRNFSVYKREMKRRAQYVPPPPPDVEQEQEEI